MPGSCSATCATENRSVRKAFSEPAETRAAKAYDYPANNAPEGFINTRLEPGSAMAHSSPHLEGAYRTTSTICGILLSLASLDASRAVSGTSRRGLQAPVTLNGHSLSG